MSPVLLALAPCSAWAQTVNVAIPNFYTEPGGNPARDEHDWTGTESIDPATGALILRYRDLVVPGNGGLDIAINRTYRSLAAISNDTQGTLGPAYAPSDNRRTIYGIGWDLNFGRVWRSSATGPEALLPGSSATACRSAATNSRFDPVLELPDGSRDVLAAADSSITAYAYVTAGRWIARCVMASDGGDGGLVVTSPEGVVYTMNKLALVYNSTQPGAKAYHVSRITHPNGTFLSFAYLSRGQPATGDYALIDTITGSDGRQVKFDYFDLPTTTGNIRLKSVSIVGTPARQWNYDYSVASSNGTGNYYALTTVTRPDGQTWNYTYRSAAPGLNSIATIGSPRKLTATYTYSTANFVTTPAATSAVTVVFTKVLSGSVTGGTWQYRYTPASSTSASPPDRMNVFNPDGTCIRYLHTPASESQANYWKVGTLQNVFYGVGAVGGTNDCTSAAPSKTEVYTWASQQISSQAIWRPAVGNSTGFISTTAYLVPVLSQKQTIATPQTGTPTTYTAQYQNYDTFGNPRTVVESGNDGTRTKLFTYDIDTARNIVNRLDTESVTGIPGIIDRTFNATTGTLTSINRRGVTTSYTYYTSGASQGEVQVVTNANSHQMEYSSYKNGVPRSIHRRRDAVPANDIVISRVVDDAGNVTSETNGRGKTTGYQYDGNNLVSGITTPRTDDNDVSIARTYGLFGQKTVLTRGTYQETRFHDGFGKLTQVEAKDLGAGATVFQNFDYDGLGRLKTAYNPNEPVSQSTPRRTAYTYDALGQLTAVSQQDGSTSAFAYQSDGIVVATDERGYKLRRRYRAFGDPSAEEFVRVEGPYVNLVTEPESHTTTIARNLLGLVTGVTRDGLTRTYNYDPRQLPDSESHPETGLTDVSVDGLGNLTSRQVGASGITVYVRGSLDRLDTIDYPSPTVDVSYTYYDDDLVKSVTRGSAQWNYNYDDNGNLQQEKLTLPSGVYVVDYTYDGRDALSTIMYPSVSGSTRLTVSYSPDALGRPSAVSPYVNSVLYWPNGQPKTIAYANGVVTNLGQNDRLLATSFSAATGAGLSAMNMLYAYDLSGNPSSVTDFVTPGNSKTLLQYDGINQLTTANGPWENGSIGYDKRGNIKTKFLGSDQLTLNYDAQNRLSTVTGTRPYTFTYDVYGNITGNGAATFQYNDASNMTSATQSVTTLFAFDGLDNRISETASGSSPKYSVYARNGKRLYEHNTAGLEAIDFVYLGERLVAKRAVCYSSLDTDGDGVPDCFEIRAGTNPASASDGSADPDADGLTNLQEYQAGTDLHNADSDGDGIPDGYEQRYGIGPLTYNPGADPDGDGLTNLQEYQKRTNPTNADTDHDGKPDGSDPNPLFNPALIPILELILQ